MAREEVELALSGDLYGGDPRGLIEHLGLIGRPLGDNRWKVWPNNEKTLISHHGLADETEFANRFEYLDQMPMTASHLLGDPELLGRFDELEGQLEERMSGKSDLPAMFHRIQTDIVKCTTNGELVAVVRQAYEHLGTVWLDSTGEFVFPDRSAHLIVATDLLIRRVRLPAIMFRFDQDRDAMRDDLQYRGRRRILRIVDRLVSKDHRSNPTTSGRSSAA